MSTLGISGSVTGFTGMQDMQSVNNTQGATQTHKSHGKHHKPNVDDIVSKMSSDLNLSDDQKVKLKTILEKDFASREADMKDQKTSQIKIDSTSMKSKIQDEMNAMNDQIKSILNPDQLTKFNSMISNSKNNVPVSNADGSFNAFA